MKRKTLLQIAITALVSGLFLAVIFYFSIR